MCCPSCKGTIREIKNIHYEKEYWCYGCGAVYKIILISKGEEND
jgi:uncharacterized protein YbaR (Trm112 family)